MNPVSVKRGDSPIVLAFPHAGTWLPAEAMSYLNSQGARLTDTDWHVNQLYCDLLPEATTVSANFHRYLIDANRDPSGQSLYPGQNTTSLVPLTDFDNIPLYNDGAAPDRAEIEQRLQRYHRPYHQALGDELARLKARYGSVILFDCHSIRSQCPFLFAGKLPDLNIGDNDGSSCAAAVTEVVVSHCQRASNYSTVVNGRFKGGWTTRHYGRPNQGIHALQLELAQSCYLQSEVLPFAYDEAAAAKLRPLLQRILQQLATLVYEHLI